MTKIKIAFIISNLGQGGAERQLVELLKGIDKKKFQIDLILFAYQKELFYKEVFDINGITIIKNELKNKNVVLKIIEAVCFIRKITKEKYNLIFTSLFMNNLFVRIATFPKYKDKIVANSRNSILLYTKYHLFVEKILINRSYLVFNSKDALSSFKKVFHSKYHGKLRMVYNGFAIKTFYKKNENKNIVIGALGRQSEQKNFIQLVKVFKLLNKDYDNKLKLILQGNEGDETPMIKEEIDENILLRKPSTNIEYFFNNIDLMVLPSRFEGCPNVLFESMIYRTLCVVSKGANSDEFVVDAVNGFVYDGSDEDLLKKLKKAISILGTEREKEIVENAFQYVKKNFSMEKMVKNYENLFLEIYEKNESRN